MRIFLLLTLTLVTSVTAEFTELWRIGESDNECKDFSQETHATESVSAESSQTIDDHYYFNGTYDKVGTLQEDEPVKNFERALTQADPSISLYFTLEEVNAEKEYRLELDFIWGGHLDKGTNWEHRIKVSLNNQVIGVTPPHKKAAFYYLSVPVTFLKKGANTLKIERLNDKENAYTSIDTISLQMTEHSLTDTDKDGFPDDWERCAGTNVNIRTSTPCPLTSLIGINFISAEHPEEGSWMAGEINGLIPQRHWNQMGPMRQWHEKEHRKQSFHTAHISAPRFGQLINSSGALIPKMSITTQQSRCATTHSNLGTPASKLLNGFLDSDKDYPATVTLNNIPYDTYDLYVYVSSDHSGPQLKVSLNKEHTQSCQPLGSAPVTDFLPYKSTAHPSPVFCNVLKFSGLSDPHLELQAQRINDKTCGVAALQLVNTHSDLDKDALPDWYELQYGLNYSDQTDGKADPDSDGLNNYKEYQRLTHPLKADTDGDTLSDLVETNSGHYVNKDDTGTDPLTPDTDKDRLSDYDELYSGIKSNPFSSDTDKDGVSDQDERKRGTSPNSQKQAPFGIPTIEKGKRFCWEFPSVQLIWDHGKMAQDDWRKKSLFHIDCLNETAQDQSWGSFQLFMHHTAENEVYFGCFTRGTSGFTKDENTKEQWIELRDQDYTKALGFSGTGARDVSDPLHIKMEFLINSKTKLWDLTYTVINLKTQAEVVRIERADFTPVPSIQDGSAKWKQYQGLPYAVHSHNGIQFLQSTGSLKKDLPNIHHSPSKALQLLPATQEVKDTARFLNYASFGPTPELLLDVHERGKEAWISTQLTLPPTYLSTYVKEIYEDYYGHQLLKDHYGYNANNNTLLTENIRTGIAKAALTSEDQLRQRVAYSLSQLIVVSRKNANINKAVRGLANYYDIFVKHAFGNYKDILREVTFHPCMGTYLSSAGSSKANPERNQFPDENYARELMQLFTCGLWELHPNGERVLDALGKPIPTYTNKEITESARVFTGLWFGARAWKNGGWQGDHYINPMEIHVDRHDFLEKTVLKGVIIPARSPSLENAHQDIEDMLTAVVTHPSTAPYVSRFLIQQLITDNPSPSYISRVSQVFSNNGQGETGDLAATIQAILLDPEALSPPHASQGKLKEPFIRYMHAARLLKLSDYEDLSWWDYGDFKRATSQEPLNAPSVFNFYSSEYDGRPSLRENGLVSPVFQITNDYTSVSLPNTLWKLIEEGVTGYHSDGHKYRFPSDYRDFLSISDDTEKLIQYVNLYCCGGRMQASTQRVIRETVQQLDPSDLRGKIKLILYIGLTCTEGAVQQ